MMLYLDNYSIWGTVDEIIEFLNKRGTGSNLNPYISGSLNPIETKDSTIGTTCPHCGKSHFMYKYSIGDGVYRPTIIKDGKVQPLQPSTDSGSVNVYECLECGKEFTLPDTTISADTKAVLGAVGIKTTNEVN